MFEVLAIGRDIEKTVASFPSFSEAATEAIQRYSHSMVYVVRNSDTDERWSYNEMKAEMGDERRAEPIWP